MNGLGLRSIVLFVTSLEEARAFYRDLLGLSLVEEGEAMLLFDCDHVQLAVFRCQQAADPEKHSRLAGSTVVFSVRSVADAMSDLRTKGVRFLHSEPAYGPLGRYAAFIGPSGIVHEICEPLSADGPPGASQGGPA